MLSCCSPHSDSVRSVRLMLKQKVTKIEKGVLIILFHTYNILANGGKRIEV